MAIVDGYSPSRMLGAYQTIPWSALNSNSGADQLLVGADPNRVILTISPPDGFSTDYWQVCPQSPSLFRSMWRIFALTQGLILTYHDWGPLVGMAWYISHSTATGFIGGWSVSYDPGLINTPPSSGNPGNVESVGSQLQQSVPPPVPAVPGQPQFADPVQQMALLREMLNQRTKTRAILPLKGPVV